MSQPQAATPPAEKADRKRPLSGITRGELLGRAREGGIIYPFIILFIVLALWKGETFYGKTNLLAILDQQSSTLIIAAAGTLVLVAGGIDLSVGATYALASVVATKLALSVSPVLAIFVGIAVGLAHRVLVMRAGRITAELNSDEATEAAILGAAFGATGRGA